MLRPIVHLCYAGTSGASRVALNIAHGARRPARHAYVLFGVPPVRADYGVELAALGCSWTYAAKRPGLDWMGYRRAAVAVLRLRPAVAVLHGSRLLPVAAWLRAMRRSLPLIAVQHGPSRELTGRAGRGICAAFSALARRTVTVSADMADLIGRYGLLRRCCGPVEVIVNGLDAAWWDAPPPRLDPGRPLRIGMVAALADYKDHATLLRAAARLGARGMGLTVAIVGAGPTDKALRALTGELRLGGVVQFHGELTRPGVRDVVHGLDVLVHATRSESFGVAVVEGMLAARPVVATDTAGLRQVIENDRTGLLVPAGDAEALAGALASLARDPDRAERLGAAARASARDRFSVERMTCAYERLASAVVRADTPS